MTRYEDVKKNEKLLTLISLLVIVPVGFYSKFYSGPGSHWVNNSLGGLFYEIFWCLLVFFVSRTRRIRLVALGVLVVTCCLEFLQLWHPPFLTFLRSYFIGAAILGTTFVWSDFLYYFLGCGIGWFWMRILLNYQSNNRPSEHRPSPHTLSDG